jgi:hypothetical protein
MRAYGLPRHHDVEHADAADLNRFALKASAGVMPGPGGDRHSPARSSASKRATRRYWKRLARREGRAEIRRALNDE